MEALETATPIRLDERSRGAAIGSDDALDSVACVLAAYRATTGSASTDEEGQLEGWIYA